MGVKSESTQRQFVHQQIGVQVDNVWWSEQVFTVESSPLILHKGDFYINMEEVLEDGWITNKTKGFEC